MAAPIFYGERLREAREARDFSLLQVAEHLGVTKQAVSLYEKAKCRPSFETFEKLVDFLRVPPHYFSQQPIAAHTAPTFYRSMASTTKRMRGVAEQKLKWLRQITAYLSASLEFPAVSLPDCTFPSDPNKIAMATVESAADSLRRFWGLGDGVISNVVHLLENKGIVVSRLLLDSERIDGFSIVEESTSRPFAVLAADKATLFRSRIDAAHELGHIILHRNVPPQVLDDTASFKQMELQAFRFAGAFLMPAKTFSGEYLTPNFESFKRIKLKWKCSIAAMVNRAAALKIITESQAKSMWLERTRKGWRYEEPFDKEHEPEVPHLLARALQMIATVKPKDQILTELALDRGDVESITGAVGFFDEPHLEDDSDEPPILKFSTAV